MSCKFDKIISEGTRDWIKRKSLKINGGQRIIDK
jgi:hypothetical protein